MLEDEVQKIVRGDNYGHWSGMIDLEVGEDVPENIRIKFWKSKKVSNIPNSYGH